MAGDGIGNKEHAFLIHRLICKPDLTGRDEVRKLFVRGEVGELLIRLSERTHGVGVDRVEVEPRVRRHVPTVQCWPRWMVVAGRFHGGAPWFIRERSANLVPCWDGEQR